MKGLQHMVKWFSKTSQIYVEVESENMELRRLQFV